jgi:hypothetical protein
VSTLQTDALDRALLTLGRAPSFTRFCETAEPLFDEFVAGRSYVPWLGEALDDLARNASAKAGVGGKPYHLWATMHGRIAIVTVQSKHAGNPNTLTGHAYHRLMKVIAGDVRVTRWRHPQRVDPGVLDRRARLEIAADEWCSAGATLRVEAGQDVVEFREGHGVVVGLDSAPIHHTRWAYDRASLAPIAVVVADATIGRIEHALQMLGEIGSSEDAAALDGLMKNHVHSVRWSALRVALKLGRSDGQSLLERALEDPHPHIRNAAASALGYAAAGRRS